MPVEPAPVASDVVETVFPESVASTMGGARETASVVGVFAHSAIAILAPTAHTLHPDSLVETVLLVSRSVVPAGRQHRRNSTLVAGYAAEYLRGRLRPRAPWVFVGAEVAVAAGSRVDLAWRHEPTGTVVFDEIKTVEAARRRPEEQWLFQCKRYAVAGRERFGDAFAGVRLLPLGSMNVARFVTPDGEAVGLAPTVADALAGTGLALPGGVS